MSTRLLSVASRECFVLNHWLCGKCGARWVLEPKFPRSNHYLDGGFNEVLTECPSCKSGMIRFVRKEW